MGWVLIFCALVVVNAQDAFVFPPLVGINVSASQPVTIQWTSNAGSTPVQLTAYQNAAESGGIGEGGGWDSAILLSDVQDPGSYVWTPTTIDNLPISDGFHFSLAYGSENFNSGALFIVNSNSTTTPTSSSTSQSSLTSSRSSTSGSSKPSKPATRSRVSSSTSASTTPTSPGSTSIQNTPATHNNETLKVGLGAGLGIGIPFLLTIGALAGYVYFRRTSKARQKDRASIQEKHSESDNQNIFPDHSAPPYSELSAERERQEAPMVVPELRGDGWRHELPH